jgi:hypothetical protein
MSFSIRADGIFDPAGKYPNPLTGQPYSKQYLYWANKVKNGKPDGWTNFQPWKDRIEIIKKIHKYNILLAIIPPGTGKTVILPKLLLHYFGYQRPIICTTPRQETTKKAGEFAAKTLDVPLWVVDDNGNDITNPDIKHGENRYDTRLRIIGYSHGSTKDKSNANTLLLFTTDGTVKQKIISSADDPNLSKYGGVIIDEAHERSVNIDIVIALLMDIVKRRPDFKVIIMSATIDEKFFTDYFKRINLGNAYSVYKVPGLAPLFKRDLVMEPKTMDTQQIVDVVYNRINQIISNPQLPVGDILAFVTSDTETKKIKNKILNNMRNYPINNKPYPISFTAQTAERDKNIATGKNTLKTDVKPTQDAPQGFARKVIIGTNVVESSVTFDDPLVYVIETGLAFEKKYDAKNYCFNSGKFYVSKASIDQRCGRTGRTCDGKCFQLYNKSKLDSLFEFTDPKILTEDFTKEMLGIIALSMNGNLQKGLEFIGRMIENPKNYQISIYRAYNNLANMDFLDTAGNITILGHICKSFNKFDLKIAKMIVGGYYFQCHEYMIILGAILQTVMGFDDIFMKPLYMDEDEELKKQYDANIKRLKHDRGDHLTLLKIYVWWLESADPNDFAEKQGLDINVLDRIQKNYKNLIKEFEVIAPYLPNLNLFTYPTGGKVQYGGFVDIKPKEFILEDGVFKGGYKFDGEVDYLDSETESITSATSGDFSDDDSDDSDNSLEEQELRYVSKMPSSKDIDILLGGAVSIQENNSISNNSLLQIDTKQFLNEVNNSSGIQNSTASIDLFDIPIGHVGGNYNNDFRTNGNSKKKQNSTKNTLKSRTKYEQSKRQWANKTMTKIHTYEFNGGGAKEQEIDKENQTKLERNKKIMDIITLKGLPSPKVLNLPANLERRIYGALFYGYSNNIAAYTGIGKKYHVKFSPEKGSISKSVFDYNGKIPAWVIYHEFTITKNPNRPDDAKLSIVSELTSEDFLNFLDINDIRKQL